MMTLNAYDYGELVPSRTTCSKTGVDVLGFVTRRSAGPSARSPPPYVTGTSGFQPQGIEVRSPAPPPSHPVALFGLPVGQELEVDRPAVLGRRLYRQTVPHGSCVT